MIKGFKEKYSSIGEMVVKETENDDFEARAAAAGIDAEHLKDVAQTLVNIDKNKNIVPTDIRFTRVRVGKLTVPVSFVRHIELLAKFANVSEESVWQLLMVQACTMYADRYGALLEVLNEAMKEN